MADVVGELCNVVQVACLSRKMLLGVISQRNDGIGLVVSSYVELPAFYEETNMISLLVYS